MGAELYGRGRVLAAVPVLPVGGVQDVAVAVWETEVHPFFRGVVQLVGRPIVAHPVAAVVREPQFLRFRVPVEAHGVSHARGEDLQVFPVRLHPHDRGVSPVFLFAHIARRPHGNVEKPVGPEGDVFPSVVPLRRKCLAHDHGLRRVVESVVDVVEPQDAAHLGDVEGAVPVCNPVGHVEPPGDRDDLIGFLIAVLVYDGVDFAFVPCSDEEHPLGAECQGAGALYPGCIEVDPEARRKLDLLERKPLCLVSGPVMTGRRSKTKSTVREDRSLGINMGVRERYSR